MEGDLLVLWSISVAVSMLSLLVFMPAGLLRDRMGTVPGPCDGSLSLPMKRCYVLIELDPPVVALRSLAANLVVCFPAIMGCPALSG